MDLESVLDEVLHDRVPSSWRSSSYLSLRPLGSYLTDLSSRVEFFQKWAESRQVPRQFWLPAFFYPKTLLTAVMQNFARENGVTVEDVKFRFGLWIFSGARYSF